MRGLRACGSVPPPAGDGRTDGAGTDGRTDGAWAAQASNL